MRYDKAMRDYEDAAVLSRTSLAAVNVGQGAIIGIGLVLVMGFAGWDIQAGRMSVGDFVAVNTYICFNFICLEFPGICISRSASEHY